MLRLTHIAPCLPPSIDGVGDYCRNLWEHWPVADLDWQFIVLRGARETHSFWPEIRVDQINRSAAQLRDVLIDSRAGVAVVHYVGYGFHPRGIPSWLIEGLVQWRRHNPKGRFVPMFHELYATGSVFQSAFWLKPLARRIVYQLVRRATAWVTSCEAHARRLRGEFHADAAGKLIPIGSNIPRSANVDFNRGMTASNGVKLKLVVFGLPFTRIWTLRHHKSFLRALVAENLVESITLLGKSDGPEYVRELQMLKQLIGKPECWQEQHDLPAPAISKILAGQDVGFVSNEPETLTKSGVFAALASHGVLTVVSNKNGNSVPPMLGNCILLNDEKPEAIQKLLHRVRQPGELHRFRASVRKLADSELSWPHITREWAELLNSLERPVSLADSRS